MLFTFNLFEVTVSQHLYEVFLVAYVSAKNGKFHSDFIALFHGQEFILNGELNKNYAIPVTSPAYLAEMGWLFDLRWFAFFSSWDSSFKKL